MHGPATEWEVDVELEKRKSRLGLTLFAIYTLIYAVFIYINVSHNNLMSISVGGLNVAIVYGFSMIIVAFIFAAIYSLCCTKMEKESNVRQ